LSFLKHEFTKHRERNHMKIILCASLAALMLAGCCAKAEISKPAPPPLVSANPAFISVRQLEK
jgi:uncharacterized lipoprotein YajG